MAKSVHATWLGHSTFTIETPEGKTLLIDPWVKSNPACPEKLKQLDKVDVLLCTHGHFDHIGDAIGICKEQNPVVVGIFELCAWLNKKGAKQISPMNKGGSQTVGNVRITMIHADHSCGIQEDDGSIVYGGEACGFVLEFSNGQKIYLMPIDGHYNMGPREAALAVRLLAAKTVLPLHFGTFPLLTGKPGELKKVAAELGFELMEFKPGERKELRAGQLAPAT